MELKATYFGTTFWITTDLSYFDRYHVHILDHQGEPGEQFAVRVKPVADGELVTYLENPRRHLSIVQREMVLQFHRDLLEQGQQMAATNEYPQRNF